MVLIVRYVEPTPAHLDTSWFNESLSSSSKDASTIIMLIRLMLHLSVMNTNKVILRHSFGFGYYMSTYLIYFFSWIYFVDNHLTHDIKATNFEFLNYSGFFRVTFFCSFCIFANKHWSRTKLREVRQKMFPVKCLVFIQQKIGGVRIQNWFLGCREEDIG